MPVNVIVSDVNVIYARVIVVYIHVNVIAWGDNGAVRHVNVNDRSYKKVVGCDNLSASPRNEAVNRSNGPVFSGNVLVFSSTNLRLMSYVHWHAQGAFIKKKIASRLSITPSPFPPLTEENRPFVL